MQFANHGSLESHGFARNRFWSIDADPPPFPTNSSSRAFIDLILKPSEEDMKIWPHRCCSLFLSLLKTCLSSNNDDCTCKKMRVILTDFSSWNSIYLSLCSFCSYEFRLRVALGPGGDLMLTSRIRNTSTEGKLLTFTFAYHTYFSVSDIRYLHTFLGASDLNNAYK